MKIETQALSKKPVNFISTTSLLKKEACLQEQSPMNNLKNNSDKNNSVDLLNEKALGSAQEKTTKEELVWSVEKLNSIIRQTIEGKLDLVWVRGEISNFKAHSSGHYYFSLKDEKSQIKALMFRGYNSRLKFKPYDGLEVLIRGKVTVYEPRGDYQIACEYMEPMGAGALQKAYEQLKEKLKKEGLFENSKKRALPFLPQHIAIVTSPTGAAIRDMLQILKRRNKWARVTLIPTVVQGEVAAPQIVDALKLAWKLGDVDVIIIGRGGGSIEDMWCFNDEILARAIAASPVPVISAVGHEIDFTIADFVADVRAPTPSAAAELVIKNADELILQLQTYEKYLVAAVQKTIKSQKHTLEVLCGKLVDPRRRLQELMQKTDHLTVLLVAAIEKQLKNLEIKLKFFKQALVSPEYSISIKENQLELLNMRLINAVNKFFENLRSKLKEQMSVLDSLSPLRVVDRGYSVTSLNNKIIKSIKEITLGDKLQIKVSDGQIQAQVFDLLANNPKLIQQNQED